MCVCVCVCVCVCIFTNPFAQARCNIWSIVKWSLTGLNLEGLPSQDSRTQSGLLFTHSWRADNCIHAFSKSISAV